MLGYGPPTFAQSRGHMGDFPAVRQLVAEAVSPVLRLRGGGVEAEAASPTPAPPLYPENRLCIAHSGAHRIVEGLPLFRGICG